MMVAIMADTRATFVDITLSELAKLTPEDGSGGVAGNLSYEEEEGALKGTMARPVKRTSVILKKKANVKSAMDDSIVAYVMTDDLGNYYFTNVPDGEYDLIVDGQDMVVMDAADGKVGYAFISSEVAQTGRWMAQIEIRHDSDGRIERHYRAIDVIIAEGPAPG